MKKFQKNIKGIKKLRGSLKKYSNTGKMNDENEAWAKAVKEKHKNA